MKQKIVNRIIQTLKAKGAQQIRSVKRGAKKPRPLRFNWGYKKYRPDVVAIYPDKRDLFAVEKKITKKNISELVAKWILFGDEARKQGGKFYLVVPPKKITYCKEIIDNKRLSVNLLPALT